MFKVSSLVAPTLAYDQIIYDYSGSSVNRSSTTDNWLGFRSSGRCYRVGLYPYGKWIAGGSIDRNVLIAIFFIALGGEF